MENLDAGNTGTASVTSSTLIEDSKVESLPEIKADIGGRFKILGTLAASEDYTLFLARDDAKRSNDSETGDLVRLKVLSEIAALDSEKVELFYLEASAASRLSHPNIARTSEAEYSSNLHLCASEHYPNVESLRSLLNRRGWLPAELAASIASQAAEALEYAYMRGVLHLNLQPESILIGTDGRVLVTDFGISANEEYAWAKKARSRRLRAQYLSPEQAQELHLDYMSDLYSLGVLLFEMLTDRLPFDSPDPEVVKQKHIAHAPQAPQVYRSGLSALQSALVMGLLEKNPDTRCHNTPQLHSVLASLGRGSLPPQSKIAVSKPRQPDIKPDAKPKDNLQPQNEAVDNASTEEVRLAPPQLTPAKKDEESPELSRDPFYEDHYALAVQPIEAEVERADKPLSADPTEQTPNKPIEGATNEIIIPSLDAATPPEREPNQVAKRDLFEPPTITVIDPPLNEVEHAQPPKLIRHVAHHKVEEQGQFAVEPPRRSKWRWGILLLLSLAIAILISILLARGNHLSGFLRKSPATETEKAPADVPIQLDTSKISRSTPAQIEDEKKDTAAINDVNLAVNKSAKETSAPRSVERNRGWRTQPIVRSQNVRARRLVYRSQARRINQLSKQRLRNIRARNSKLNKRR